MPPGNIKVSVPIQVENNVIRFLLFDFQTFQNLMGTTVAGVTEEKRLVLTCGGGKWRESDRGVEGQRHSSVP